MLNYLLWYTESQDLENRMHRKAETLGIIGYAGNFRYAAGVVLHQRTLVDSGKITIEDYHKIVDEQVQKLKEILEANKAD